MATRPTRTQSSLWETRWSGWKVVQRFTCVDLTTGDQKWTTEPHGQYWSLVAQGDRILALDQRGELLLIHATPEKFDLLDSRKISEQETWGHLAVSGEQVFIRELNGVTAYRWK